LRHIAIAVAFLSCGVGFAGSALAAQAAIPTDVDAVVVTAAAEVRLSVAAGGDMDDATFVTSAPVGLGCGGWLYRHSKDPSRQCWLWVRRNKPVMLTAQAPGRFGSDWTVEWAGCTPVAGGAACELSPGEDAQVAAVFKRTGQH